MAMFGGKSIRQYEIMILLSIQIDDSIMTANGLSASSDFKTIYVAATSEKRVSQYF